MTLRKNLLLYEIKIKDPNSNITSNFASNKRKIKDFIFIYRFLFIIFIIYFINIFTSLGDIFSNYSIYYFGKIKKHKIKKKSEKNLQRPNEPVISKYENFELIARKHYKNLKFTSQSGNNCSK